MTTNSQFFNSSREIVDNYIQNILFVDDEIFVEPDRGNSLDGVKLSNIFSKAKKLCTLNQPQTENDLSDIIDLAKKADVTVLDWKIHFKPAVQHISVVEAEQDEDEDDPRGKFTLNLIERILSEQPYGLKLIMIYTGETDLEKIVTTIKNRFEDNNFVLKDNALSNSKIKIIVCGKQYLKGTFKHSPNLNKWVVDYNDIPSVILSEFTEMTQGLISNVILDAITSIRNNSSRLLGIYDKKMDAAFLSHRSLLPVVEDASELLKESIVASIKAIFDYEDIISKCSLKYISEWIDHISFINKTITISKKDIEITNDIRKKWQKQGFEDTFFDELKEKKLKGSGNNEERQKIKSRILQDIRNYKIHDDSLSCFLPNDIDEKGLEESFSILTHHKSNHASPTYIPRLSLGSVIKGEKTSKYWVCIQQRCDSVRIPDDMARRFLFLPLETQECNKKFSFIVSENQQHTRLREKYETYEIRTIKFAATENGSVLAKKKNDDKYYFCPLYASDSESKNYNSEIDEEFIWLMDLKDAHAQRIANKFASNLCRVGLDDSEWLRRNNPQ